MPEYAFKARVRNGGVVEGEVTSPDRGSAILQIERVHGTPVAVREMKKRLPPPELSRFLGRKKEPSLGNAASSTLLEGGRDHNSNGGRLNAKQQLFFTKQMAKLLKSGMTLEKALESLAKRSSAEALSQVSQALHRDLVEGARFSAALGKFPTSFSRIYVSLVAAGESSGSLPLILERLARYMDQNRRLVQSVKLALVYPAVLSLVGVLVIIIFVTMVVPQLTTFLESTGAEMPLLTRMLIGVYEFGLSWWWAILAILGLAVFLFQRWVVTPVGGLSWDRFKLRIPLVGQLIWSRFSAQAAMTLGTLLNQGVLLSRAMELIKEIGGNRELAMRMEATIERVEDGQSLSASAASTALFPPLFLDMLQVGEQSGELADSLEGIAEHYEEEVQTQATLISTLFPVMVILVISTLIGLVVISIFMAIFNVTSGLRRSMAVVDFVFDLPWC